jgi:hypothetical protein
LHLILKPYNEPAVILSNGIVTEIHGEGVIIDGKFYETKDDQTGCMYIDLKGKHTYLLGVIDDGKKLMASTKYDMEILIESMLEDKTPNVVSYHCYNGRYFICFFDNGDLIYRLKIGNVTYSAPAPMNLEHIHEIIDRIADNENEYLVIYGSWDSNYKDYPLEAKHVHFIEFTNPNGYSDLYIREINSLEVNDIWHSPGGNHKVIRVY